MLSFLDLYYTLQKTVRYQSVYTGYKKENSKLCPEVENLKTAPHQWSSQQYLREKEKTFFDTKILYL